MPRQKRTLRLDWRLRERTAVRLWWEGGNSEAKQALDEVIRQAQAQNALAAEAQLLVVRG
jgi:hypothetical protein